MLTTVLSVRVTQITNRTVSHRHNTLEMGKSHTFQTAIYHKFVYDSSSCLTHHTECVNMHTTILVIIGVLDYSDDVLHLQNQQRILISETWLRSYSESEKPGYIAWTRNWYTPSCKHLFYCN